MNAAEIAKRLGLRRVTGGRGWAGACPACGYQDGLRLAEKQGRALWCCASCTDRAALSDAVMGRRAMVPAVASIACDAASRTDRALDLWDAAQPIQGGPVACYLAGRGLPLPDGSALRYLPNARHPSGARAGCMIALAVDAAGRGVAVHRTYLAPGGTGKARLDPPRATLGPVGGAVVRLCDLGDGARLVIGEGIESTLSAGLLTGSPAWAALSAGNMARVPLPDAVGEVLIAADHDVAGTGQRAAWAAADAFTAQGRRVSVICPDTPGEDFNDLLQRRMAWDVAHG